MTIFLLLTLTSAATAGTVSGVVTNGTKNKPLANAEVILIQLQGGMQAIATVKTDASGHFTINNSALGTAPMLLRVPYKGVLYHQPVTPGATTANVEVYEPTTDPRSFSVASREIILQPKGSDLLVGEEYIVENQSKPPVAYYLKDGTFHFHVPEGAQLNQVSAWGASGMPVTQGAIDKGKNVEAVDWPFRPGENGVRISYQMPYSSQKATVQMPSDYNVEKVMLIVPPGLQVSSPGFSPAGTEQGYDILVGGALAAHAPLSISVSGAAQEPSASAQGDNSQNPDVNSRADTVATTTLPPRLDNNVKYILVAGFAALFLLGVIFLWRRPAANPTPAGATAAIAAAAAAALPSTAKLPSDAKPRPEVSAPPRVQVPVQSSLAQMDHEVSHSLDEIKERLFRLELRRQAGTLSEEEYLAERQRAEKILRDFVKG